MNHFCREASQLMSDGYERELSPVERIRLRLHLWMCGACSNHGSNLGLLHRLFADMRKHADTHAPALSEQDRQKIRLAVHKQTQP